MSDPMSSTPEQKPFSSEQTLIIVPTYNEAENIKEICEAILVAAPDVHILVVDDNSKDGTQQIVEQMLQEKPDRMHILKRPGKAGLGKAYVAGFHWALARKYAAIVEMDADFSHDPKYLPALLENLKTHDFVVGSRYVKNGGTVNWGLIRQLISRFGSLYSRLILGLSIRDLTGGFNGWRRHVLEAMNIDGIRSEGYAFQIELKYRGTRMGYRHIEMPIIFVDRKAGHSKMSSSIVLEAIFRVWQIRGLHVPKPGAREGESLNHLAKEQ